MIGPNRLVKNVADSSGKPELNSGKPEPKRSALLTLILGGAVLVSSIADVPLAGQAINPTLVGKGQKAPSQDELNRLHENIRQQMESVRRFVRMNTLHLSLPDAAHQKVNAALFQSLQTLNDAMRPYVRKEYIAIPKDPTVMLTSEKLDSIKIDIDGAFLLYPMLMEAAATTTGSVKPGAAAADSSQLKATAAARDSISFASVLDAVKKLTPPSITPKTTATPQAQKPLAIAEAIAAKLVISQVQKLTTVAVAVQTPLVQQRTPAEGAKYNVILENLNLIVTAQAGTARTRYLTAAVRKKAKGLSERISNELDNYNNAISQPGAIKIGAAETSLNLLRASANEFNRNRALQNALKEAWGLALREDAAAAKRRCPLTSTAHSSGALALREAAAAARAAPGDPLLNELLGISTRLDSILADPTLNGRITDPKAIEDVKAGANTMWNAVPDVWKLPGEKPEGKEISPRLEMYVALSTAATALAEGKLEEAKQRFYKDPASSALAIFRREMALLAQSKGNPAKSAQKEALKKR